MVRSRSSRDIIEALTAAGFQEARTKGDHVRFKHPDGRATTVPHPKRDMPIGTLKKIERDTGVKLR